MEERCREVGFVEAQVGDRGAEGRLVDRDADDHAKRQQRIDQRFTKLGFLRGIVRIEMQPRRVHGHGGEEDVVSFGDRTPQGMRDHQAHGEFFEPFAGHWTIHDGEFASSALGERDQAGITVRRSIATGSTASAQQTIERSPSSHADSSGI